MSKEPTAIALTLAWVLISLAPGAGAASRTKIAVLDLDDQGAGKELTATLTTVVASALTDLRVFEVVSRADIQNLLSFEQDKQLMGCTSDSSCLAEIGGALGVGLLVTGMVGRVGEGFVLSLTLTDTASARVLQREQRQVAGAAGLVGEVSGAARVLVRELLQSRQGTLILSVAEPSADIEIDGQVIGVTPLPRLQLGSGPHRLRLLKRGFVAWSRDITVLEEEPLVVDAALVPSIELIEEHEASAFTWRLLAYTAAGVGAAASGFGLWGYFGYNAKRARLLNADVARAGCDAELGGTPTVDCVTAFGARRDSIATFDVLSQVIGWAGALAMGTGAWLFLAGPDPDQYERYRSTSGQTAAAKAQALAPTAPTAPAVHATFLPLPGGGLWAGATITY